MNMISLVIGSMRNRSFSVALTIVSIALSILLLLTVERLRHEARESFANTVSGTDLIVGARSGQVQLLLYSIFRIGNPTNNLSWDSYEVISKRPEVTWSIPLSLGDSHRGFRVLGTNQDYFRYYRFGGGKALQFATGKPFTAVYDAVIGADVARELGYELGSKIVLAHGIGEVSLVKHDNKPFQVVGVLEKTGTPVDRTVHVRLQGIEAIHIGWDNGMPAALSRGKSIAIDESALQPKTITAAMLGLKSPLMVFRTQRFINEYQPEPLLAALPGVALQELWDTMALAQQALMGISLMVVLVGVTGMATAMLSSLNERRREMAVLRSVGARPIHIFILVQAEAVLVMLVSAIVAVAGMYVLQLILGPFLQQQWGLFVPIRWLVASEWLLLAVAFGCGLSVGLIPAYRAYRYSVADGLTVRL